MSIDIKLRAAQISKVVQSGGFFGIWSAILGKVPSVNVAVPLTGDISPGLVSNLTSYAIYKFVRKVSRKGAVRAGKRFNLSISNKDMNDIIRIKK